MLGAEFPLRLVVGARLAEFSSPVMGRTFAHGVLAAPLLPLTCAFILSPHL